MEPPIYSMKCVAPTVSAILGLRRPAAALAPAIGEIAADLSGVRRVAVLAPDALGILPWKLWRDEMPFLKSLHERRSILLESIMPSITPVNFACMLTGAELDTHGMKTREMEFLCETVYDVVRSGGGKSAGVGHKGYTGELMLARCADIPCIAEPGTAGTVTGEIVAVVERHAPDFLIAQYGNIDTVFHRVGPSDPSVVPMMRELDDALEKAVGCLTKAGAGVILLADHGQHDAPDAKPGENLGRHGSDCPEDRLVPCTWIG